MPWFQKRSRIVSAMRFTGTNGPAVVEWANDRALSYSRDGELVIIANPGTMTVAPGEWVVRGEQGDFYPVSDESFTIVYEQVSE